MNKKTKHGIEMVVEEIRRRESFLISSHLNPEGDAVGSALGLAQGLKKFGKDVTVFLEDPVPELFKFLPFSKEVVHQLNGIRECDACIVVDCGGLDRVGEKFNAFRDGRMLINVDHHATNEAFGDINLVNADASSTGEIVYDILSALSVEITSDIAVNIYAAILTDTGSFRYACSTPRAFEVASEMVKRGVDPSKIAQQIYESDSEKRIRLLGDVLQTLKVAEDGRMASVCVTMDMMQRFGATKDIVDGFVNYPRSIKGIEVAILLREDSPDKVKISFRSNGMVNVAEIAAGLGGGGHTKAAGCMVNGRLDEIRERVEEITRRKVGWKNLQ